MHIFCIQIICTHTHIYVHTLIYTHIYTYMLVGNDHLTSLFCFSYIQFSITAEQILSILYSCRPDVQVWP